MFKEVDCQKKTKEGFIKILIAKIISLIFPKANPDYEDEIGNTVYWLLEFEDEDVEYGDIPNREIGLDENLKSILKMPYKKNYGYWLDSNMTYTDFLERFDAKSINSEHFNEKWDEII